MVIYVYLFNQGVKYMENQNELENQNQVNNDGFIQSGTQQNTNNDYTNAPNYGTTQNYNNMNMQQQPSTEKPSDFAIAGMVCGILSIICCCFWPAGAVLAICGLVFSIMTLVKRLPGKGLAIAGIVCAAVAAIMIIVTLLFYSSAANFTENDYKELLKSIEAIDSLE